MSRPLIAAVVVGVILIAGAVISQSQSPDRWIEWPRSNVPTSQFRSSYPWIECTRSEDGVRGHWVYAEINRVPADWPPLRMIAAHDPMQGRWQFVPVQGPISDLDHL